MGQSPGWPFPNLLPDHVQNNDSQLFEQIVRIGSWSNGLQAEELAVSRFGETFTAPDQRENSGYSQL